jgi:NAD(P)-dependent dehydrogenase (short-subunit alcohol dehydrogenase family)
MFDLTGRVALVTGAGRNVGAGIAHALASCGGAVAVNDLEPARAEATVATLRAAGATAHAVPGDVTDPAAVEHMVADAVAALGPVDILVNNAGVPSSGAPSVRFRDMSPVDWDRYLQLNLYAVLRCTRAVLDSMCERGWGRVVTIISEAGRMGTPPGLTLYAAGKAGAAGFSRVLAREVGRHGVTVNCVSLGTIDNVPVRDEVLRATPMRRYGNPTDVGAAVAYFASDDAGWVTGQTLPVNGGFFTT